MAHRADDADRPLHERGAPVDRELRLTVENHEHLLDGVVEVVSDAAAGGNLAPMEEVEVRPDGAPIEQRDEGHRAGAGMHGRYLPEAARVGVDDALRERLLRGRPDNRSRNECDEADNAGASEPLSPGHWYALQTKP